MVLAEARSPMPSHRSYRAANPRSNRTTDLRPRQDSRHVERTKVSPMLTSALMTMVAVGLVLGYLALRTEIAGVGYSYMKAEARLNDLKTEHERLRLEITRLTSLDRIEKVARAQLGMRDPEEIQFVALVPSERQKAKAYTTEESLYRRVAQRFFDVARAEEAE